MLTINLGQSLTNKRPSTVRPQPWLAAKKEELENIFDHFKALGDTPHLVFAPEVPDNLLDALCSAMAHRNVGRASAGLEDVTRKTTLVWDEAEWHAPTAHQLPNVLHFDAYNAGFVDEQLQEFRDFRSRYCSRLLLPVSTRTRDFLGRFFTGGTPPSAVEADLLSVKLLAVSLHAPTSEVRDDTSRQHHLSQLLQALCLYANEFDVHVVVGGDLNLKVEAVQEVHRNLPNDAFQSMVQV